MDWLQTEILTGFQKLLCLGLDRTPAGEVIPGTVGAWTEALTSGRQWDQQRDTPRMRAAFSSLLRSSQAWPSPAKFLEAMPASRDEWVALPRPQADPAKVRAILDAVAKTLRVPE